MTKTPTLDQDIDAIDEAQNLASIERERERKISREGAEDEGCGAGEVKRGG